MPLKLTETDEVWLALEQSHAAFTRNGHKPSPALTNCLDCHALFLINNAMRVYVRRGSEPPAQPTITDVIGLE